MAPRAVREGEGSSTGPLEAPRGEGLATVDAAVVLVSGAAGGGVPAVDAESAARSAAETGRARGGAPPAVGGEFLRSEALTGRARRAWTGGASPEGPGL